MLLLTYLSVFCSGLHPSQQLTKYDGDTGPQNDVTVRLSGRGSDGSGDIGAVESTDQQLNLPPPTRDLSDLYTLPNRMSDHQQGQVELSAANEDQLIRDSSARKDSLAGNCFCFNINCCTLICTL